MRKELLAHTIPRALGEIFAIVAILIIGKQFNILLTANFMENIRNPSFIVLLVVLIVLIYLLVIETTAIIQATNLDITDVIDSINNTTNVPLYTIKLKHGFIAQSTPISDTDIKHAQQLLSQIKTEYPQIKEELALALQNGITDNNRHISAESVIRIEIIFDQLAAGNEKILESIEENFMPTQNG